MELLNDFSTWSTVLSKSNPFQFGLLTVIVMFGMGAILAAFAEVFFRIIRIDLGKYDDRSSIH